MTETDGSLAEKAVWQERTIVVQFCPRCGLRTACRQCFAKHKTSCGKTRAGEGTSREGRNDVR